MKQQNKNYNSNLFFHLKKYVLCGGIASTLAVTNAPAMAAEPVENQLVAPSTPKSFTDEEALVLYVEEVASFAQTSYELGCFQEVEVELAPIALSMQKFRWLKESWGTIYYHDLTGAQQERFDDANILISTWIKDNTVGSNGFGSIKDFFEEYGPDIKEEAADVANQAKEKVKSLIWNLK